MGFPINKMNSVTKAKHIQTACFGVPEYEMLSQFNYRPPIGYKHMRRLWLLKQQTGKPITQLVAEALDCYFESIGEGGENR
jgi:hypothetical protein